MKHKQVTVTQNVDFNRDGWGGAWDAIKAAWKKQPRMNFAKEVTFSVNLSLPEGADATAYITQSHVVLTNKLDINKDALNLLVKHHEYQLNRNPTLYLNSPLYFSTLETLQIGTLDMYNQKDQSNGNN